jgi:peptidoglycan/LPS O-acetylase OafA/YrhL
MIPLPKSADIRGWDETYPLNGCAWSLFYEYIANIAYALGLRKLSNRVLGGLVALTALALAQMLIFGTRGDLIGGWTLDIPGVRIGLIRLAFPFLAGIMLMRMGWRVRVKHAFAVCSLLLVASLALPRFGGTDRMWINGCYEALCVIGLFPLIVVVGAGEKSVDGMSVKIAHFFGNLSYPLYITHYPLIYIYTGWAVDGKVSATQGSLAGAGLLVAALALAYACLKLYDEPVRRWLAVRLLPVQSR